MKNTRQWLFAPIHRGCRRRAVSALLLLSASFFINAAASASNGQYIANNTPTFVTTAQTLGATDPSLTVQVSVWLNLHNRDQLDALAKELYESTSPQYRHWLTGAEVAARFGPTATEAQVVKAFLESQDLTVSSIGLHNFYVRAAGTVAQVEKAFAVHINNYTVAGKAVRANASDPYVEGPAAPLIQAVSGLDDIAFQIPGMVRPNIVSGAAPPGLLTTAAIGSTAAGFESHCFPGAVTLRESTFGGYPKATYTGNEYVAGGAGCAYTPTDIRAAYNLNALYSEGYDGTGQTIVLVEACGSPTLLSDANAFSERFGLPRLSPSNFSVISMGPSVCAGYNPNIQADVEWAHAVAPGAALAVIFAVSSAPEEADEAMFYAVDLGLGNTICDEHELSETFMPQTEADKESLISEIAAVEGISANYPAAFTGNAVFFGSPVVAPADSPYGTAIGGISLALGADGSIAFETGWEDHVSEVLAQGTIFDPATVPVLGGFISGALGGPSAYFAKPSFQQAAVSGTQRAIPDFSWVADPYTGLIALASTFTQEPPQSWLAFGGTGVATSMFSALWAIANQKAGVALGQAAPYLYSLPAAAVTDIVPYSSPNNMVATVQETSASSTRFNAGQTLDLGASAPLFGPFYSAIWENPGGEENTALVLSFGADFTMKTAVGWDEVTGMGAPKDAKVFVDWVAGNNP
jgi:subtilase family serine protease